MALAHEDVTESAISAGTNHNVSYPATVNAGDLLIVSIMWPSTATVTDDADLTPLWDSLVGSMRLAGFAKIADGSEDGSTVNIQSSASVLANAVVHRISGFVGTIADDIDVGTAATGNTDADPPTATAGWGSDAQVYIAVACLNNNEDVSAYPSGYSAGGSIVGAATALHSAFLLETSASDDPGIFNYIDADAGDTWIAQTIVIGPQGGGGGVEEGDIYLIEGTADGFLIEGTADRLLLEGAGGGGVAYDETGLVTTITGTTTLEDLKSMAEPLDNSGTVTTTLEDQADFNQSLDTLITATTTLEDQADLNEVDLANLITATTILSDVLAFNEALDTLITATTAISDLLAASESLETIVSGTTGLTDRADFNDLLDLLITATTVLEDIQAAGAIQETDLLTEIEAITELVDSLTMSETLDEVIFFTSELRDRLNRTRAGAAVSVGPLFTQVGGTVPAATTVSSTEPFPATDVRRARRGFPGVGTGDGPSSVEP